MVHPIRSECGGCKEIFSGVPAFDLHRIGDFDKRTRRCLIPQEMSAKGMTRNDKGWWTLPITDTVAPLVCRTPSSRRPFAASTCSREAISLKAPDAQGFPRDTPFRQVINHFIPPDFSPFDAAPQRGYFIVG